EGLARAFAGYMGVKTGLPHYEVYDVGHSATVEASVETLRPYAVFAVVTGLHLTEAALVSIMGLQEKLHVSYCRNRRKGSIGVYDAEKVVFPLTYTARGKDFSFVPLDFSTRMSLAEILQKHPVGVEYGHILAGRETYPVLMDSQGTVLSMPPIINSEETRVTAETRNVVVDVTGLDWRTVNMVLNIMVCALAERQGRIESVKATYEYLLEPGPEPVTPDLSPRVRKLELKAVEKLLGLSLRAEQAKELLERMRYGVTVENADSLLVSVPPYRADIMHAVDLADDVAIAYGYGNFTPVIPALSTIGGEDPLELFSKQVRELLVGFGYQEVITYVLTNPATLYEKMRLPRGLSAEIQNPKTREYTVCRSWLLPCLVEVLSRNKHHALPQRIFEVDDVVELDESEETGTRTVRKLAVASTHSEADFSEAKAVLDSFLKALGLESKVEPSNHASFLSGRFGVVRVAGEQVGFLGELHPEAVLNFKLENPVAGLEIDLDRVWRLRKR
ncbi:MAG: phenylalanine--tRNA ligase subunit beta, partial [Candidatus Bathyarchaeia archaeon]